MECHKKFILGILLVLVSSLAVAESFRGKLAEEIRLENGKPVRFPIDTLVGIFADSTDGQLQGIELELTIPPALRKYRNSFTIILYRGIDRPLAPGVGSYNGELIHQSILSSNSKEYFMLPLLQDHSLQPVQGSHYISSVTAANQQPFVLSVLPVMKGIPPEVYSSQLELQINPIYIPRGKLYLALRRKNDGSPIEIEDGTLFINGEQVNTLRFPLTLPTGIHSLRIKVDDYKEEFTNFSINDGENTRLTLDLTKSAPTFTLEAPSEATVLIDGSVYTGSPGRAEEISTGIHSILIKIGDYSISKKIDFKEGKNYNISLFFDIFIEED